MADDKRAEAMRKAIAASDKKREEKKDDSSGSGKKKSLPISIPKLPIGGDGDGDGPDVAAVATEVADKAGKAARGVLGTKMGKIGAAAVVAVVVLLVIVKIVTGMIGGKQNLPAEWKITDSLLCVYLDEKTTSGLSFDAYVEIENTGESNIYASDAIFRIQTEDNERLMDDQNITIFPAVIKPGEKGYLFSRFGNELVNSNGEKWANAYPGVYDGSVGLQLIPAFAVKTADAAPHSYQVENVTVGEGLTGEQAMTCNVTNDTTKLAETMYVVFVAYNADHKCVGISSVFESKVQAHAMVNVRMDPLTMVRPWKNETIVDYMIYAY